MRRRFLLLGLFGLLGLGGVLGVVSGSSAATPVTTGWGSAVEVPGLAALDSGRSAWVTSVSCSGAGDCEAGGFYTVGFHHQAFVVSETNGSWGDAVEVPGTAALNSGGARVTSVSCASAGECAAGGLYIDGSGHDQAFVASETNGSWGDAVEVPGTATLNSGGEAQVTSVSCGAASDCVAGGFYTDSSWGNDKAFVASETNGSWDDAVEVPGTAGLNTGGYAQVNSVSCPSAGDCAAGGVYFDSSIGLEAFVASETNGIWSDAIEVPGTAALNTHGTAEVTSLSCGDAGNCAAGGYYMDSGYHQAFVASQTNGSWGDAVEVPGTAALNSGGYAVVSSVSCASAGDCAAGGSYREGSYTGDNQAFVASETNGSWGDAVEVPGTAALNSSGNAAVNSVSCGDAGDCAAGGYYGEGSGYTQAFMASETNGSWDDAVGVADEAAVNSGAYYSAVNSVSCGAADDCAAGGFYYDCGHWQAFVLGMQPLPYAVTYAGDGATGGSVPLDGSSPYDYAATVTALGAGSLTRTGYTFNGWNTAADGSCTSYEQGSTFSMPASAVTLYAQWQVNSYAVTYDGNGATGGSTPSDGSSPYNYGATVTVLGAGSLTRTGYTFNGWNTAAGGGDTSYQPGDTFPMPAAAVTLYARWTVGPLRCVVPHVVGKTLGTAEKTLKAAHCGLGKIEMTYSKLKKGRVVAQHPKSGKHLKRGGKVALTVSQGKK